MRSRIEENLESWCRETHWNYDYQEYKLPNIRPLHACFLWHASNTTSPDPNISVQQLPSTTQMWPCVRMVECFMLTTAYYCLINAWWRGTIETQGSYTRWFDDEGGACYATRKYTNPNWPFELPISTILKLWEWLLIFELLSWRSLWMWQRWACIEQLAYRLVLMFWLVSLSTTSRGWSAFYSWCSRRLQFGCLGLH